ncbi:S1 family peptidase [Catenulispora rubra]|uniref:S1 family peptidase n=1 Tax=Catenulispora rubra TaxID=280293 RepID=UPI00189233AE|nr:serine protease [Catenulispora rubra]
MTERGGRDRRDYVGIVGDSAGNPVGTCFQVAEGILVTAWHVIEQTWGRDSGIALDVGGPREAGAPEGSRTVSIRPMPPGEPSFTAEVVAADRENDLAVLRSSNCLKASVELLAASDKQASGTAFTTIGYADHVGVGEFKYRTLKGSVNGLDQKPDNVVMLGCQLPMATTGFSGAPLLRAGDDAVIGVQTSMFKKKLGDTADVSAAELCWAARVEILMGLLAGHADPPYDSSDRDRAPDPTLWMGASSRNRDQAWADQRWVESSAWTPCFETGAAALIDMRIVVVAAADGVGATTFAERLLASHGRIDIDTISHLQLPDIGELQPKHLPLAVRTGYVLDLRDPSRDTPSSELLASLRGYAAELAGRHSQLVITMSEQIWRRCAAEAPSEVAVIHLKESPDAAKIVAAHLAQADAQLVAVANDKAVTDLLAGRTAARAGVAVKQILAEAARYSRVVSAHDGTPQFTDHALRTIAESVAVQLDDYEEHLNALFAAPGAVGALSPDGRVRLLAVCLEGSAQLGDLNALATDLATDMGRPSSEALTAETAWQHLSEPGLHADLAAMDARVNADGSVTLIEPGRAAAIVRYVWKSYDDTRVPMARWIVRRAGTDSRRTIQAVDWLCELVIGLQDQDFVSKYLVDIVTEYGRHDLLQQVMARAVTDPHLRRSSEALLYTWAGQPRMHPTVHAVCRGMLTGDRREVALTRLRRTADHGDNPGRSQPPTRSAGSATPETLANLLEILAEAAADPDLSVWFRHTAEAWFRARPRKPSSVVAFAALLSADREDIPWLCTVDEDDPAVSDTFAELLRALDEAEWARRPLTDCVTSCSGHDEWYVAMVRRLTKAVGAMGAAFALFTSAGSLAQAAVDAGRDLVKDLNEAYEQERRARRALRASAMQA